MKKIFTLLVILLAAFGLSSTAQNPNECNPDFTFQFLTGSSVKFTPANTGDVPAVQHYWLFGDGTGNSSAVSPTHSFPTGVFNVKHILIRFNPNGVEICRDSLTKVITVQQGICNLIAGFNSQASTANPLNVYFSNTSGGYAAGDSVTWTFGDGSVSHDFNPAPHLYANAGTYNVCLRLKRNSTSPNTQPCVSEICHQVVVTAPASCNLVVSFTSTTAAGQPNVLQFQNTSTGVSTTDTITWNFGDGSVSHDLNPVHTYTTAGTYQVCLIIKKVTMPGTAPCVGYSCHTITVTLPPVCNISASFTSQAVASNPATIQFTNTSTGYATGDSVTWTFGDGGISHDLNPSHTYTANGNYQVCLRIKRNGVSPVCISEVCHAVSVTLPNPCNLNVSFTSQVWNTMGNAINFTSTSTGYAIGDSITWTFGDGLISHDLNPIHTYANAGTYHVCLIIKKNNLSSNTPCIREFCTNITVTVTTVCNLTANFTWYRDSTAVSAYTYHFTNTTSGLSSTDSIRWTFGDGTTSNVVSPNHVYAQPGTYQVCLRVQKRTASGVLTNCISEKCYTVVVAQQCNIHPSFTWRRDSLNYKKIIFTNTTPITTANVTATWGFGDGTTATSWNAVHEYAQAGTYTVCLHIQYGNCSQYYCDTIVVAPTVASCLQLSNYHYTSPTNLNQIYYFAPNTVSNDVQYTWTFGDGTGALGANASHHFATPGYYTVCLTAYKNAGCASTTCNTVYVPATPNCANLTLSYTSQPDSLMPTRIKFTAVANAAISSQQWTITKLPVVSGTGSATINQNNPTYVFIDTGYFRVCVRATYANGCVKEYCDVIHITQSVPNTSSCTLQAYPNPASSVINTNISLTGPQMIYGYIYNNANVLVRVKQQQGFAGNNIVSVTIGDLPAGVYTFKVVHGNDICSANFIKQ